MHSLNSTLQMQQAESLESALALLADSTSNWTPFAGGSDLMVELESGAHSHAKWLGLGRIPELKGITLESTILRIGACTTYQDILNFDASSPALDLLKKAAMATAAPTIQARGTIGGNVASASPAADSVPALLALEATLLLRSKTSTREVALDDFFLGYRRTDLREDELIQSLLVPLLKWSHLYFRKVGSRRAQAISKVVLAAGARIEAGQRRVRIGIGSVGPTSLRCKKTECLIASGKVCVNLIAEARQSLQEEISPIDDLRSTAAYRSEVAANLLEEFMLELASKPEWQQA
jgi:CO/xanthine dehydrogenase FAD-binding subunit